MTGVAKVITIIGSSPESFADAVSNAVAEASRSVRNITGADVISMSAEVSEGQVTEFRATVNLAFAVEVAKGPPYGTAGNGNGDGDEGTH
jgi:flavin-binding protein dodecin